MNKAMTQRSLYAVLGILGLAASMGCGKKEEPAALAPGGVSPEVQSRLNDPNIPPDIKEKIKASSNVKSGGAAPTAGGGN